MLPEVWTKPETCSFESFESSKRRDIGRKQERKSVVL